MYADEKVMAQHNYPDNILQSAGSARNAQVGRDNPATSNSLYDQLQSNVKSAQGLEATARQLADCLCGPEPEQANSKGVDAPDKMKDLVSQNGLLLVTTARHLQRIANYLGY